MSGVGNEHSVAGQEAWEGSQEETSDPETEGWENSFKCTSVMCVARVEDSLHASLHAYGTFLTPRSMTVTPAERLPGLGAAVT